MLDVISKGYKLPFIRVPDPCFIRNNRSAELHPSFVEETIIRLLAADCMEEHLEPPYCVNPLLLKTLHSLSKVSTLDSLSKVFEQNLWSPNYFSFIVILGVPLLYVLFIYLYIIIFLQILLVVDSIRNKLLLTFSQDTIGWIFLAGIRSS